ncbi:hypothetical protein NCCNTM_47160 [Mycolicibacterium sp. NCC-Tsukiji]|nr:hypothetical protein NCCNTM_47160 [Mycolicibacterium sp. NCC-Tsukiji]
MLAKAAAKVPDEAGLWSYEPKWDGFLHWICQPSLGDLPLRGACSGGHRAKARSGGRHVAFLNEAGSRGISVSSPLSASL